MACKTKDAREEVKVMRGQHINVCTLFCRRHELCMDLGKLFPEVFLSLGIDGMDNQKI
jgi:hypothetical protein